jgi:hypothetical protein
MRKSWPVNFQIVKGNNQQGFSGASMAPERGAWCPRYTLPTPPEAASENKRPV